MLFAQDEYDRNQRMNGIQIYKYHHQSIHQMVLINVSYQIVFNFNATGFALLCEI